MKILCRPLLSVLVLAWTPMAWAVPTCTVASGGALAFGPVIALASTPDVSTNTGTSFWINCTADVATTPAIYSGTPRTMVSGGNSLPFALSAVSPGGLELRSGSPGTPLTISKNGSNETVTLYGKIFANDFKAQPAGVYLQVISLTVEY